MIPFARPGDSWKAHRQAIEGALHRVLDSGRYILGPEVEAFEREFAAACGSPFAIGVGSGTDALHLALRALGIGAGDEVIVPSHTAVATIAAVEMAGAIPVFADIEAATFTLDPARVDEACGPKTKAILAVHLYGQPADLDRLGAIARSRGLLLIEDCAQAHGARHRNLTVGSIGDAGCFSFYPTKNLGAFGDGGLVCARESAVASRIRELREYGWRERYHSATTGFNSRLDELQAAILREKLPRLGADTAERQRQAAVYLHELDGTGVGLPRVRPGTSHVFHLFVVRSADREGLKRHLQSKGIGAAIHYPLPVHLQDAYRGRVRGGEALPESERACREILSLPLFPGLTEGEQQTVIDAVKSFRA
ncbi:MAG: DegT/DnrJ/EryC1/StrS family aminotransferase [Spirochaetes bacterium]|nr:DegT/DnrJ/EryC1/StrS family aminotransferase [Spirochaetota bacterium]